MEKLNDLRFIIGLFFTLVGALLFVLAFTTGEAKEFGKTLNHYAGAAMLIFGLAMLWLGRNGQK